MINFSSYGDGTAQYGDGNGNGNGEGWRERDIQGTGFPLEQNSIDIIDTGVGAQIVIVLICLEDGDFAMMCLEHELFDSNIFIR